MFQRSLLALPGPQDQRVLAPDAVEQGLAPRQIIYCRGSRVGNLSSFSKVGPQLSGVRRRVTSRMSAARKSALQVSSDAPLVNVQDFGQSVWSLLKWCTEARVAPRSENQMWYFTRISTR